MKYKKITDFSQYNVYCNRHEQLIRKDAKKYIDEIELLEILIDDFDKRKYDYKNNMDPVEILNSIQEEEEISNAQLAKELGTSRQLISDIRR